MEALQNFLEWLGGYVWGAPLLILLGGTAIYLSFRLLFLQVHMLPSYRHSSLPTTAPV